MAPGNVNLKYMGNIFDNQLYLYLPIKYSLLEDKCFEPDQ